MRTFFNYTSNKKTKDISKSSSCQAKALYILYTLPWSTDQLLAEYHQLANKIKYKHRANMLHSEGRTIKDLR